MGCDPKAFRLGSLVKDCSRVLVASGRILIAKAKGIVDLVLSDGSILSLYDVLYVPDLTHNLISVDALQATQIGVDFPPEEEGGGCTLKRKGVVIEKIPRLTGLYSVGGGLQKLPIKELVFLTEREKICSKEDSMEQPQKLAMTAITLDDLHHRLGHTTKQKLLHLVDNDLLEGVQIKGGRNLSSCFGCAMGKLKRHVMKTDYDKPATKKLDLIHMDLMGPFRKSTR
jgi:hypothetical protein